VTMTARASSTIGTSGAALSAASAAAVVRFSLPATDDRRAVTATTGVRRALDRFGFPAASIEPSEATDQSSLLEGLDQPVPLAALGLIVGLMLALTLLRGWTPRD
jgi:hypothetical protein